MKIMNSMIAMAGAALLTMVAVAQTAPPVSPLISVTRVVVKSDRIAEWMDIEKLYSEAYQKGGGTWRRIYRARVGNLNEFVIITPLNNYADLDGQTFIAKGASEQDRTRWAARRSQCTESATTTFERLIQGATIGSPVSSLPPIFQENRYRVKQGMGTQFADFVKTETIPALKKAGVGFYILRQTHFGGSRNVYVSRRGLGKYAELDENLTQKVLGPDGSAKYYEKSNALLNDVDIRLYVYQPTISYAGQQ